MTTPILADALDRSLSRRDFIDQAGLVAGGVAVTVAVAGCAGGAASAGTGAAAASTPLPDGPRYVVALGDAPELSKVGGVLRVKQEDFDFFVVRQSDDTVIALNNVCSHKNCATKYDPAANDFACPCHKSRFDLEGVPNGGPAKDPLKRYPATLADGVVTVALQI
ncbi:Rieske (2Fe-2S) protein [Candidatus Poribacteria bacterium]|jgi:cytochrome b6-f complex iron-sulfur subunit|nr:Rieske (2Fe-2S) protein [Candidatus Poribacteria bacterium]MBT5532693.1 Rieske (2Fe-2S) protein [Candidatus Poribacteria bacterium]MBT5714576.1 Rieske (2Fe-2S) protein [Candidatus Poribacteria bacterium]MBT7101490.1 Rieske (2Fe-2S) protein [Candidatus Poribacteria bacterium]MBT7808301.1 Rieske (2Fe-2S) protein [Candidatus Poribacteria bacterium]